MYKIYLITNLLNGKVYVGQTSMLVNRRWSGHRSRAASNYKNHLYASMNKHGINNFKFQEIASVNTEQEANNLERLWIVTFRTFNPRYGYNSTLGGERTKFTLEARERMSLSKKGRIASNESKERVSISLKKAWKDGRHKGMTGKRASVISVEKSRKRMLGINGLNYLKNIPVDEVVKLKKQGKLIREIAEYFGVSYDTIARRLSASSEKFPIIRTRSEETKKKISKATSGRTISEEHRRNTSAGITSWWKKRKNLESI